MNRAAGKETFVSNWLLPNKITGFGVVNRTLNMMPLLNTYQQFVKSTIPDSLIITPPLVNPIVSGLWSKTAYSRPSSSPLFPNHMSIQGGSLSQTKAAENPASRDT